MVGSGRLNGLPGGLRYEGDVVDFQADGVGILSKVLNTGLRLTAEPILRGRFERGRLLSVIRDFGAGEWSVAEIGVVEMQAPGVHMSVNAAR